MMYAMMLVIRSKGATMRTFFFSVYVLKNVFTWGCITIYWLFREKTNPLGIVSEFMVPKLIYTSTLVIFVIQIIGLFIPRFTNIINPEEEKKFPLKRIKENMFFIVFNLSHVLILVGGRDVPIQYVLMFCQIFAFFRIAAQSRLQNSLITSIFCVITGL